MDNVMQENYDNLRRHHALLIKQACKMARLLKLVADENDSKHSTEAERLIVMFENEVPF